MIVIEYTTIIIALSLKTWLFKANYYKRRKVPQQSRYTDAEFERMMNDIILVLEKHNATRDLSLMVLGNVISHIFEHQVAPAQRQEMAEQYANVLIKSVKGNS